MHNRRKDPDGHVPAVFMLQVLEDGRGNEDAEIMAKLLRREITRGEAFFRMHPVFAMLSVVMACSALLLASW